eukprot:6882530-Prorocentrum_lima.AAC.1
MLERTMQRYLMVLCRRWSDRRVGILARVLKRRWEARPECQCPHTSTSHFHQDASCLGEIRE